MKHWPGELPQRDEQAAVPPTSTPPPLASLRRIRPEAPTGHGELVARNVLPHSLRTMRNQRRPERVRFAFAGRDGGRLRATLHARNHGAVVRTPLQLNCVDACSRFRHRASARLFAARKSHLLCAELVPRRGARISNVHAPLCLEHIAPRQSSALPDPRHHVTGPRAIGYQPVLPQTSPSTHRARAQARGTTDAHGARIRAPLDRGKNGPSYSNRPHLQCRRDAPSSAGSRTRSSETRRSCRVPRICVCLRARELRRSARCASP
jgi:hypothetical protein